MTAMLATDDTLALMAATCRHCDGQVLRTVGATTGQLILLDATPAAGGLFELRPFGGTVKATRRNMIHVTREIRRVGNYGGGYSKHVCPPPQYLT